MANNDQNKLQDGQLEKTNIKENVKINLYPERQYTASIKQEYN